MGKTPILDTVRRSLLWTAFASTGALLVLVVLWAWGAFTFFHEDVVNTFLYRNSPSECFSTHVGSELPVTAWGSAALTLAALAAASIALLVALHFAKSPVDKKK